MNYLSIIISAISTLTTISLFIIAWRQLTKISINSKVDFILKYERDFYSKDNKEIITYLDLYTLNIKITKIIHTLKSGLMIKK